MAGVRGQLGLVRGGQGAHAESLIEPGWPAVDERPLVTHPPYPFALSERLSSDDRILRPRNYFFTPDVIAEVCNELGLPHRVNGYRYW